MALPKNEITVLTFEHQRDGNELSVTIDGSLTMNSSLAEVMKVGLICEEFNLVGLSVGNSLLQTPTPERVTMNNNYKFLIKKKNNTYYTFRWERVCNMTVGSLVRLQNTNEDYVIIVAEI